MIQSILDDDLYKFTMCQAVISKFPTLKVRYKFTDRNDLVYPEGFSTKLLLEIHNLSSLSLTASEEIFLRNIPFINDTFVDFLKGYKYDPSEVSCQQDDEGHLIINIEGFWYRTILWEVKLMSLISELYFKETDQIIDLEDKNLELYDIKKAKLLTENDVTYADFGTRRRYSYANQERIVKLHRKESSDNFIGTSNVHLAKTYNIKAIGTMAHEWTMVHGALYGYKMSNHLACVNWADVYGGDLGIALPDTYTTNVFLRTFDKRMGKLFDGMRQDSDSPFTFADKAIRHYNSLKIDPISKSIVFSDSLNPEKAVQIKEHCDGKIKSSFGIGTNFTNDLGVTPLNIVIKISEIFIHGEWIPCVKLSDNPGKHTGNEDEIKLCKGILRLNKYE